MIFDNKKSRDSPACFAALGYQSNLKNKENMCAIKLYHKNKKTEGFYE